jgi:RND superfamily putative drug exporter
MSSSLYELGRRCFLRPGRVLLAWLLVAMIGAGAALALGDGTKDEFDIPGSEANDAYDALGRTFPELAGLGAYAVVVAPDGQSIESTRSKALVDRTVRDLEQVPGVTSVTSPYDEMARASSISEDGRAAQVQVQLEGELGDVTPRLKTDLQDTGQALEDSGYTVAFGGDAFSNTGPKLSIVEVIGVVVALFVLYRMFRSWRAAFLPIVTAVVGVVVTMELLWTATGFLSVSSTAPLLALMIGLAVGIDYALFIVSRHRELMSDGVPADEAAGRAVATAGSAVVFAGVTVMIALVGLAVARIPFLTVMGVAGALAVAVAVAVALTLLPALLGRAGERLRAKEGERPPGAFSRRWVLLTTRFPSIAMVLVVGVLAVATLPVKDLQLALPDNGSEPVGTTQRDAYDLVDENFGPGYNGPLLVTLDVITTNDPLGVVDDVERDLRRTPGVETIGLATPNRSADTAVIQVVPTTGPADPATADLVDRIRAELPRWEEEHGVDASVTGLTAVGIDVSERLKAALVPFGVLVVGLSVLLLMVVFRSLLVPLKATLGFVLSTGAAFGAVVAVFEWGWFADLLHVDQTGPLISFLPILLMAVLFGLSMDYEVFLMSRMKEEYVRTGDPDRAIVDGFVGSSRVVTAAAVIMLAVFAAFVPEGDVNIKPIAFALAMGVFADAFLVRMLFAPAVMRFAGHRAWWLPARLSRVLPHVDVEGEGLHQRVELEAWPRPGSDAAVTAAGLTLETSEGIVYNDVTVDVPAGDWLVVHGPSGSGKTALLLTIAGRMAFDEGRLRVAGHLLPQEGRDVRRTVALAEFHDVNDLDPNLTVDQHVAERLSISSVAFWVPRARVARVRDAMNDALAAAHAEHGLPFAPVDGATLVSDLTRLERKTLGVVLALVTDPELVVVDDVDDLRATEHVDLLWSTLAHLLEDRRTALVASVQSATSAPSPSPRLHLLELDTRRTLDELMI